MNEYALRKKLELNMMCIQNTKFTPHVTLECADRKDNCSKTKGSTYDIFSSAEVQKSKKRMKYRHRKKKKLKISDVTTEIQTYQTIGSHIQLYQMATNKISNPERGHIILQ